MENVQDREMLRVEIKKVTILDWKSPYYKPGYIDAYKVEFSPDEQYAVIELFQSELFIAVRVREITETGLVGEYLDSYEEIDSTVDLRKFSIDWTFLDKYGLGKLKCFELESGFSGTKKRLWFDKAKYTKECSER